jgi:hypothetical protein
MREEEVYERFVMAAETIEFRENAERWCWDAVERFNLDGGTVLRSWSEPAGLSDEVSDLFREWAT